MKKTLLAAGLITFGLGPMMGLTWSAAHAANADNPYGNVDHRNDAGNNTGDSRVDGLNANQLNGNYKGAVEPRPPSAATGMYAPSPPPTMPPPPGSTIR
jgi:hypothetical protein